ncbi:MAG: NERD domain-containing protein, partial [Clostridia bacterium]|nr:NERD domain-containing protein [Clostridia bacterium]
MLENNLVPLIAVFVGIIIFAAALLFLVIKIKSAKRIKQIENYGKPSEKRLKELLEKAFSPSAVFSGVYIPYTNGERDKYAEMDAVLILRSGVYVIELKSHNGKIINGDTKYWTQIYNDKRISFYNPLYQNTTHSKVITNIFKSEGQYNVPVYNVIVFSSQKVTFTNSY